MNKIITIIAFILLGLALIWGVLQMNEGKEKDGTISSQENTISTLEASLEQERESKQLAIARTEELTAANVQLKGEKKKLDTQISRLEKEINNLKLRINTQRETIEGIRTEMKQRESAMADLQQQISGLNSAKSADRAKLKDLEKQRATITSEMEGLRATTFQTLSEKDALVNDLLDKQEEEELYRNNLDIIEKTVVNFQKISLRKEKNGRTIKRLKKKNWNYTVIELSLYHDQQQLLKGQDFSLTIIDLNTGKALPLREANPKFPDSENNMTSMRFTFDTNPIVLEHTNTQEKTSNNYQVQLTYVKNNRELPMKFGVIPIISNNKPVNVSEE